MSTVKNPIRTRTGELTKDALFSGLTDQRGWLGVDMNQHRVLLRWNPANEKFVVSYHVTNRSGELHLRDESCSFPKGRDGLTAARIRFRTAGRPGCWPDPKELR